MINEEKLKELLKDIMIWTTLSSKPDVMKLLEKKLNEVFEGEQKQLKALKKGRTELAKKRLKDKREAYLRAKRALNRLRNRN